MSASRGAIPPSDVIWRDLKVVRAKNNWLTLGPVSRTASKFQSRFRQIGVTLIGNYLVLKAGDVCKWVGGSLGHPKELLDDCETDKRFHT
jgi:hypothetical protein